MSSEISQEDAQRAATQHQQMTSFAGALAPKKTSCSACLVKGVVTAYTYPYITVQVDGDTQTSIANVRHLEAYSPVVGDTCSMLKQGSDLLAIGRINTTTAAPANNGWVTPTLGSGFTSPLDVVRYRIVNDNGDKKVQFRGTLAITGAAINIFTLTTDYRPLFTISMIAARNASGGSNAIQVQIANTGGVSLLGYTTGLKDSLYSGGTARTGLQSSNPVTTSNGNVNTTGATNNLDLTNGNTAAAHVHIGGLHTHTGGDHQHYMDAVDHPTSVSLNGLEYFL